MKKFISAALLAATCASANAGVIFSDNFDAEAGAAGNSVLNYNSFANWTVSDGTVDVVANTNGWGIDCVGNTGKCVDLDGSNNNAGTLTSSALTLAAASYTLSFDISGNQRDGLDIMQMSLGGFVDYSVLLFAGDPWQTVVREFTVSEATANVISFNNHGGDNVGIMLDNVSLVSNNEGPGASVDEPATLALLGLGLLGLGAARRKQQA